MAGAPVRGERPAVDLAAGGGKLAPEYTTRVVGQTRQVIVGAVELQRVITVVVRALESVIVAPTCHACRCCCVFELTEVGVPVANMSTPGLLFKSRAQLLLRIDGVG